MEYKNETKSCQNCTKDFIIEIEDFNFYEKIKVPPPTFCPECRMQRRMAWRNERSLYRNKCAFSGKDILSMFAPETGFIVYERDIWWSDKWDPVSFGQDYDFSKPFFEQFKELMFRVPLASLGNTNCPGTEYSNHNIDCRNCYLIYASIINENVSYAHGAVNVKDSFDLYAVMKSEQCYDDVICAGLFKTNFSYDSDDSINSSFLTSCVNLQDCLGCINLRHKSYCIFNKQYSKEEYKKEIEVYDFGSYKILEKFKKKYNDYIKTQPRRYASILKSTKVTGDNILTSKNSKMIFDIFGEVEDSKYITHAGMGLKNSYDGYGMGARAELLYEGVDSGLDASKNLFSILTHRCLQTNYTYMCYSSKNLFGCVGLQKQEYCILNKKYSKEEYKKLIPKIIQHMNNMSYIDKKGRVYKYGEFFPAELSPFGYNETIAQEYYSLTKKEVQDYGFNWKSKAERNYKIEIKTKDLSDHIKNAEDSIIGKVIGCLHDDSCNEQCTEAFKILSSELQFYKKNNIALPRLCPNCRHYQRLKKRNPLNLWHRQCMCEKENHFHRKKKCIEKFETPYSFNRPEIVYCEQCYQQEVY